MPPPAFITFGMMSYACLAGSTLACASPGVKQQLRVQRLYLGQDGRVIGLLWVKLVMAQTLMPSNISTFT